MNIVDNELYFLEQERNALCFNPFCWSVLSIWEVRLFKVSAITERYEWIPVIVFFFTSFLDLHLINYSRIV